MSNECRRIANAEPLPASVVRHPKNFDGQKIIN
jgi:hypothetical protein